VGSVKDILRWLLMMEDHAPPSTYPNNKISRRKEALYIGKRGSQNGAGIVTLQREELEVADPDAILNKLHDGMATVDPQSVRVLVDTSSLMQPDAERAFETYWVPWVKKHGIRLAVPHKVIQEIERHRKARGTSREGIERRQAADAAHELLTRMESRGIVEVYGGSEESFADNVLQMVIVRFRIKYHLWLLTQDRALVADVLKLSNAQSVQTSKTIRCLRIGTGGCLQRWNQRPDGSVWYSPALAEAAFHPSGPFQLCSGHPDLERKLLRVTTVPGDSEWVLSPAGKKHRLTKALGAGGEGRVFLTDTGLACKLYSQERLTETLRRKLQLMVSHPIESEGLSWPIDLALNQSREFVGYLMPVARGRQLQRTVFVKPLLFQHFPHWTRRELVTLALTITQTVQRLHEHNVLLGDINPLNILVDNERSVFFVDTDSYQVEAFPCPVGTPIFVAPELAGQDLSKVLRTFNHEHFAVATLVFMMLVPGKPPYSHTGGADPAGNVREGHFPYPLGEKKSQGVPDGPWRFIWSHLPRYVKNDFHKVFTDGERPTTADWVKLLQRYLNDLESGFVSKDIFPKEFRRVSREETERFGGTWHTCEACGEGFGDRQKELAPPILCPRCRNRPVTRTCDLCGEAFEMRASREGNPEIQWPLCPKCRARRTTLICIDCGAQFNFPGTEELFYKKKGLIRPRRCPQCRKQRKTSGV